MAEVIDLLSSPFTETQQSSFGRHPAQGTTLSINETRERNPHFSSDDFNSSIFDEPDWLESQSAKRRKLSPLGKENEPALPLCTQDRFRSRLVHDDVLLPRETVGKSSSKDKTSKELSYIWNDQISDPIIFTSSAPETRTCAKDDPGEQSGSEDDHAGAEPFSFSQPTATNDTDFSQRTKKVLEKISAGTTRRGESYGDNSLLSRCALSREPALQISRNRINKTACLSDEIFDSSSQKVSSQKSSTDLLDDDKKERHHNQKFAKAIKKSEKQEEKERKIIAKEQKAKEKQLAADLAEVNKSKVDKKNSTPEMILDISASLRHTSLGNQIDEFMKQLGVESHFSTLSPQSHSLVQWRRKVSSRYDEGLGYWVPTSRCIERERHVLVYLPAQSFIDLAIADSADKHNSDRQMDIRAHVTSLKESHPLCGPIYLIEGLSAWMRKNRNAQNRAYQAAVLGQVHTQRSSQPVSNQPSHNRRKKTDSMGLVEEDIIEDALLQLQVEENCLIHHTTCVADTAYWIKNFTEHISTIPYRQERIIANEATAFCMDIGQVKTGEDVKDTYIKMLQEVQRVTPAMAYGIVSQYPNVRALVNGFKRYGPDMLQDVRKSANKNGAVSDTRLGPKVSKRLYKVFTCLDPASVDGIV